MKKKLLQSTVLAGVAAVAHPVLAYDIKISDSTYVILENHLWASYVFGGDDTEFFGRAMTYGVFNHTFENGMSIGVAARYQFFTDRDKNVDNLGDGPDAEFYTGIVYATGAWGDVLYGKTFGAVTELVDIAPSAIGVNYSVNTPFFIHKQRPRFAPRSPTASPDFRESNERFGYYSPNFDGFRLGVTYAENIEDDGAPSLTNVHSKNALDVAMVYTGQFGDVRLRMTGGYQQAEADVQTVNAATAADQNHWVAGSTLWWKGWTIGGNYAFTQNTLGLKNIDNESWQAGVMYAWNKFLFSASYGTSTDLYSRDLAANPILGGLGDTTMNMTEFAVSYQINKNAKISAAAITADFDDRLIFPPFITTTVSNSGTYGVLQLYVKF